MFGGAGSPGSASGALARAPPPEGKTDLLLRFFDSEFFDEWIAGRGLLPHSSTSQLNLGRLCRRTSHPTYHAIPKGVPLSRETGPGCTFRVPGILDPTVDVVLRPFNERSRVVVRSDPAGGVLPVAHAVGGRQRLPMQPHVHPPGRASGRAAALLPSASNSSLPSLLPPLSSLSSLLLSSFLCLLSSLLSPLSPLPSLLSPLSALRFAPKHASGVRLGTSASTRSVFVSIDGP